jgi:hypothetical protein
VDLRQQGSPVRRSGRQAAQGADEGDDGPVASGAVSGAGAYRGRDEPAHSAWLAVIVLWLARCSLDVAGCGSVAPLGIATGAPARLLAVSMMMQHADVLCAVLCDVLCVSCVCGRSLHCQARRPPHACRHCPGCADGRDGDEDL